MTEQREITYQSEILRKGIHLLSLSIPFFYFFVDKATVLMMLVPLTFLFVGGDVLIHRSGIVRRRLLSFFGPLMRPHELRLDRFLLNGASYVLLSACLCVFIFPKIIAITAFSILIISDICAALVGRRYGSHRFLDKSLEGTLAFVVSALIVVTVVGVMAGAPFSFFITGCFAALLGSVIENISPRLKLDDNFSIPVSIGLSMWTVALLLFRDHDSFLVLLN